MHKDASAVKPIGCPAVQVGVDGPLLLTRMPEQITWASEQMHTIRRLCLTGSYTPNFKPNCDGKAPGYRDGNTRTSSRTFRTGEQVYEWRCEDYNGEWLPGGTDYEDQVGDRPNQLEQVRK